MPASFMNRQRPALLRLAAVMLALGCTPAGESPLEPRLDIAGPALATATGPKVVISQVYGAGGNSGALFTHDYVELYNAGSAPATLSGMSLQYASATGTGAIGASGIATLYGTLNPGRYYLVKLLGGATGQPLPAHDAEGSINAAAGAGKFALVSGTSALGCNTAATCTAEQKARIVDLVGYGSANYYEGTAAAPTASAILAVFRKANGAQDTDDNRADFEAKTPAPRNGSTGGVEVGPLASLTLAGAASIKPGFAATITAVAADAEGDAIADGDVTWSVDGTSVEVTGTASRTITVRALTLGQSTVHASITQDTITRTAAWMIDVVDAGAPARITVSFPPGSLPPGFDYFPYPTVLDADGAEIRGPAATLTYTTSTPHLLSIDPQTNIITTKAEGRGFVTLTAPNGYAYTFFVDVNDGAESGVSYQNHVDFGTPVDATPDDDRLVTFPQYVASYNAARGQPNWVAYNLEASHRGASDRCDCFTSPDLPGIPKLTTFDYTNSGYSRGHLVMSEDRTAGGTGSRVSIDNARTFYFSNIIPQTSANNGGPWLKLETHLGDLATRQNREIFIFAGGARYEGTLKDEGRIAIPTYTWKIAVIMPRDQGLANVDDMADFELIAVSMPNAASMPHAEWEKYVVPVDSIERLTGYDFLAALPDHIETIVESRDRAPTAVIAAMGGNEGQVLTFDGRGSSDPDVGGALDDTLSYRWIVNGAETSTSAVVSGGFHDDGPVSIMLVVTDRFGWADTATTTVVIANVAPTIAAFGGATLLEGETYAVRATFADPGRDTWAGTVDYGDGSGVQPLTLDAYAFSLSHRYATAGTYTVAVTVRDDDAGTGAGSATVIVQTPVQGVSNLEELVAGLGMDGLRAATFSTEALRTSSSSALNAGELQSLRTKLRAASASLQRGSVDAAVGQLSAFINEMEAMGASGRVPADRAQAIIAYARRVVVSAQR